MPEKLSVVETDPRKAPEDAILAARAAIAAERDGARALARDEYARAAAVLLRSGRDSLYVKVSGGDTHHHHDTRESKRRRRRRESEEGL